MKNIICISCLFVLMLNIAFAEDTPTKSDVTTTAVPFLRIAPDSRSTGMGETGVAIADNVWAMYWNPGGLAFQSGSDLGLTHTNWLPGLGLSDIWIGHLGFTMPFEELDGIVGAQITYLNLGEISITRSSTQEQVLGKYVGYEFAFSLCYSTKLNSVLGLGVNARIIMSHLAPGGTEKEMSSGNATGFSFDVGWMYKPKYFNQDLSLGLNLSNIGPKMTYADRVQADPLPFNLRFGAAYKLLKSQYNNITLTADFNRLIVTRRDSVADEFYKAIFTTWGQSNQLSRFTIGTGMEYWYDKLIAARIGYFYESPKEGGRSFLTLGFGLYYNIFGFDFGYIHARQEDHPLAETIRFSLSVAWGS